MRQHEATAQKLAEFLLAHPAVGKVHFPGLPSHPQHDLAKRQQKGFGAMLSFELKEGGKERVNHVLRRFRWFTLAESLGGVESLVAHPASMTHASMTPAARQRAGITDDLIRLSIGLEDLQDLQADLAYALTFS
jgi:cystathionine gamma-synthase